MFDKEQNPKEVNKIIGTTVDKQEALSKDNEEIYNV